MLERLKYINMSELLGFVFLLPPRQIQTPQLLSRHSYQIRFTWSREPNSSYYLIYKNITGNSAGSPGAKPIDKIYDTTYEDNTVVGSMTYFYCVQGVDKTEKSGPPSGDLQVRTPMDQILQYITIFCGLSALVLFAACYLPPVSFNGFSLTFEGDLTYKDGSLSSIIEDNDSTKYATVFGIGNQEAVSVSVSNLVSSDGNLIGAKRVELNDIPGTFQTSSSGIVKFTVKIPNQEDLLPGDYQGLLLIEGNRQLSIPISVSTPAETGRAIGFVIVGILLSIIIWEFIKYAKKNNDERTKYLLVSESGKDSEKAKDYDRKYLTHMTAANNYARNFMLQKKKREGIENNALLGLVAIQANPQYRQILQAERDSFNAMSYNEMLSASFKTMEAIAMSSAQSKARAASLKESQVAGYRIRASRILSLVGRIAVVELAIAGFGITVALIALLNSEAIAGLRVIDPQAVAILLGIGLGIGSLKEIVDK